MIQAFDSAILDFFLSLRNEILTPILKVITLLGEVGIIWIILGLILLFKKETRIIGIMILIALAAEVLICNGVIKNIVQRPRPCWRNPLIDTLVKRPTDFSFPSGHTGACFAALVPCWFYRKKWLAISATVFALIIVGSRMYFYVHYPTDILSGALIGAAVGGIVVFVVNKLSKKEKIRKLLRLPELEPDGQQ